MEKGGGVKRYDSFKLEDWLLVTRIFNSVRYLGLVEVLSLDFSKGVKKIREDLRRYEVFVSVSNVVSALKWLVDQGVCVRERDEYRLSEYGVDAKERIHEAVRRRVEAGIEIRNWVQKGISNYKNKSAQNRKK